MEVVVVPDGAGVAGVAELLSTGGWPRRLLTLADWQALPEDELYHVEVSEGVLVVVPNPHPRHQHAVAALLNALAPQLPKSRVTLPECDVLLSEDLLTVRGPDVLVVTAEAYASGVQAFAPADLRLAVEIMSPGSRRMDRVTKASEYAEAGIPSYWIVDLREPITLTCHSLDERGQYQQVGEHQGQVTVEVDGVPVALDLDALTTI